MADSMHTDSSDHPFGSAEPARDAELGALLRRVTGDVPMAAVDWDGLAARISRAVPARAVAPWWSYATRWERRMLPIALAAGLMGALALWDSASSAPLVAQSSSSDAIAEMVTGAPVSDVAASYERAMLSDTGFEESLAE
jgi:hypothetical protein